MEVVSTSHLVSLETQKTTTASNFQTMNSFVMSLYLMRGQMESHGNTEKNAIKTHTNKTNEKRPAMSWKKNFFFENENALSFPNNLIRAKGGS